MFNIFWMRITDKRRGRYFLALKPKKDIFHQKWNINIQKFMQVHEFNAIIHTDWRSNFCKGMRYQLNIVPDALRGLIHTKKKHSRFLGIRIFHKTDGRMCKKDIIRSLESTDWQVFCRHHFQRIISEYVGIKPLKEVLLVLMLSIKPPKD